MVFLEGDAAKGNTILATREPSHAGSQLEASQVRGIS
jgi:hypothetical protein